MGKWAFRRTMRPWIGVAELSGYDDATPIADALRELLECDPEDREADLCCTALAAAGIVSKQYYRRISSGVVITSYDESGNPIDEERTPVDPDEPCTTREDVTAS